MIDGACLATNAVTGHSEGAFVMSASPDKVYIIGNEVRTCSEAFFSPGSHLSPFVHIENNKAYNCNGSVTWVNFDVGNTLVAKQFYVKDNTFYSCGWLSVEMLVSLAVGTNNVEKNLANDLIVIDNNEFTNMKLSVDRASSFKITNNRFYTETSHTYSSTDKTNALKATINITRSTNYEVTGNILDNRATTADTRLTQGINCEYAGAYNLNQALLPVVKSGSGTSTEYGYTNRYVKVSNNKVINYTLGILDYYSTSEVVSARSISWIGFEIANNIVVLRASGAAYGMVVGPGAICHDNKIYSTSTSVAALVVLGVNDGSGSTFNAGGTQRLRLNGPIVYRNTIIGANTSIQIGNASGASAGLNNWNAQVRDNYVDGTVTDNTAGNSSVAGNITLTRDEALILQIIRDQSAWY
jgi:hypothetical protein